MLVTFLSAADGTPLAKTPELSYPNVYAFSSLESEIHNLPELHRQILEHSAEGHCLLKGELQRPLVKESRAKATNPHTPTSWVTLDFDGVPEIQSFKELSAHFPPYFEGVSYIEQLSASSLLNPGKGYSAHVFMLLTEPAQPAQLKIWLRHLNLTIPLLRNNIRLNKAATVLRWPLDLTTCQNDKLIYIAPPVGSTIDEAERVKYIRLASARLSLTPILKAIPAESNDEANKILASLRVVAGYAPRSPRITTHPGTSTLVMKDVDDARVTGWRHERGFCYLNLNDGDSWGYWHPEDAPSILYNFKGEPNYPIVRLLPEYHEQAVQFATDIKADAKTSKKQLKREQHEEHIEKARLEAKSSGLHYLAINDARTDTYWRGTYDAKTETLEIFTTKSLRKLEDFLKTNGQPVPESIPDWTFEYNFDSTSIFNADTQTINLYRRSKYLCEPRKSETVPIGVAKLLNHVLGGSEECVERFLNWLACIIQYKSITLTAWVLSGTQGTGKGVLFHNVLAPLFGKEHSHTTQLSALQRDYNGFMERAQIVLIDEAQVSGLRDSDKVMQVLKHLITETDITIHKKFSNEYAATNRANFILASNVHDPIEVAGGDRRFNVPPRQETPLLRVMDAREIAGLEAELFRFAGYLLSRPADKLLAMTPVATAEHGRLQELTTSSAQEIADAMMTGNLNYLVQNWPGSDTKVQLELQTDVRDAPTYSQFLDEAFASIGNSINIPVRNLRALFFYLEGAGQSRQSKFTKYIGHRGLKVTQVWYDGANVRGIHGVRWHATEETKLAWQRERTARGSKQPSLRSVK